MESGRVTVNIRNCMICMLYLLANIDRFELPENVIILKQQWPLLKEAAESNEIIDFYNPKYWGGNRITERNTILCLTSFTTKLHQIVTSNKGTRVAWKISPTNHATQNSHIMTHLYFKQPQNKSARSAKGCLKEGVKQVQCKIGTATFLDEAATLMECTRVTKNNFGSEMCAIAQMRFQCNKGSMQV